MDISGPRKMHNFKSLKELGKGFPGARAILNNRPIFWNPFTEKWEFE